MEMPQHPLPRKQPNGFYAAPTLYPRELRQVADLIEALVAFERPDPTGEQSTHFVGAAELAIYDEEQSTQDAPVLLGWVCQHDAACWVFVPYVDEIESANV